MKNHRLLEWGARHHYPQLVLSSRDVLRAGEESWRAFDANANRARRKLAHKRIELWDARVKRSA